MSYRLAWLRITPVPTLESVRTAGGWWVPTRVCLRLSRPAAPAPVVPGSLAPLSACCGPAVPVVGHRLAVDLDCCREPLAWTSKLQLNRTWGLRSHRLLSTQPLSCTAVTGGNGVWVEPLCLQLAVWVVFSSLSLCMDQEMRRLCRAICWRFASVPLITNRQSCTRGSKVH